MGGVRIIQTTACDTCRVSQALACGAQQYCADPQCPNGFAGAYLVAQGSRFTRTRRDDGSWAMDMVGAR